MISTNTEGMSRILDLTILVILDLTILVILVILVILDILDILEILEILDIFSFARSYNNEKLIIFIFKVIKMSISETISKFIETKNKLEDLQKRHERYRKIIEDYMINEGVVELSHELSNDSYQIKKTLTTRESISKKELPKEVWDRYSKTSSYSIIRIKKLKL